MQHNTNLIHLELYINISSIKDLQLSDSYFPGSNISLYSHCSATI